MDMLGIGEEKLVVMLGGVHIEKATLSLLGPGSPVVDG